MKYKVIAIEREYASGGSEIGEKLGDKLGIPCYGYEILEKAAAKLNVSVEYLRNAEENITGSLLYGLAAFANAAAGKEFDLLVTEQKLAMVEAEVIKELALSPCIIVGRGASSIFADDDKVLKVFIHSDRKARVERAIEVYGHKPKQAESVLNHNDRRRANYFKATTQKEWKDDDVYQLILNSGKLGIDQAVSILYNICHAE